MSERLAFPARLGPVAADDLPGVLVTFRDLPEAITEGRDETEALARGRDCLEEALAGRIARGDYIPLPSPPRPGECRLRPGALIAAKGGLHLALREAGLDAAGLARRLGIDEREARRLLDPRHPSRLDRIDSALAALGRRLVVEVLERV